MNRRTGQRYVPNNIRRQTRSGRFSIHVWGAFTQEGTLCMRVFHGHMNGERYGEVLEEDLWPSVTERFPIGIIELQEVSI